MLKFLLGLLCISVFVASCLKADRDNRCPYPQTSVVAPQWEQDSVEAYLDSNNLQAIKHSTGFYYNIVNPGSSTDTVGLCSQILINYKGKFVTDSIFDQQNNMIFVLGSLIEGWKKGIPLVRKGGEINLYVPPSLGYGATDFKNQ